MTSSTISSPAAPTLAAVDLRYRPEWHPDRWVIVGAHVDVGAEKDAERTQFVLDRATRDASKWTRDASAAFRLCVPFTAAELASAEFVSLVRHALHESALAPTMLALQVEADNDVDPSATFDAVDDLAAMGVSVSIGPRRRPPTQSAEAVSAAGFHHLLRATASTSGLVHNRPASRHRRPSKV